ncbi:unannotated protein [freshwater metagenome]|uniref:Unannotated protein n=1 Tax=freshwater metagenome TaxID=449393 RepID=A0A6J7J3G3_9ZZZZ|nr:hypothetical protein [Actinomycetota bacterium]
MTRRSIWFLAGVLFLVAAVAAAVGSSTVVAAAAVAIAMAMFVMGLREAPGTRSH